MECVCVHHNILDHHVNMVNEKEMESSFFVFCFVVNPCNNQNPCLNSGTCFGRYNLNGTMSTQCFCPQGFTGSYCEGREKKKEILLIN